MKIVKAMKKVSRLKGEIKSLKDRMNECLSYIVDKERIGSPEEDYCTLKEELFVKTSELIRLRVRIMHTNVLHNMFYVIVNIGELKSYIDFLRELEPKSGKIQERYTNEINFYESQLSVRDRNLAANECQKLINSLTDKLDEFNAKTDLEEMETQVELFN